MSESIFERTFEAGDPPEQYGIISPSGDDIRDADWHHAKMYSRALNEGFMTKSEIEVQLKERGIIGDDYDNRTIDIQAQLAEKLLALDATPEDDYATKGDLASEISRLRKKFFDHTLSYTGPLTNSCENLADDARLSFLTFRVVRKIDNGTPVEVWETYEDFQTDRRTPIINVMKYNVMLWSQGYEPDYLSKLPENQALSAVRSHLIEEMVSNLPVREEDIVTDSSEETTDQVVEKPKKKATKKKTTKAGTKKAASKSKGKRGRPSKKSANVESGSGDKD